jgi:hypothetical protein
MSLDNLLNEGAQASMNVQNSRFIREYNDAEKLRDGKWKTWRRKTENIIAMCGLKDRFATENAPITTKEIEQESFAQYLILQNVKESAQRELEDCNTAKQMWQKLETVYAKNDLVDQYNITVDLWNTKLKENEDPAVFVTGFKETLSQSKEASVEYEEGIKALMLLNALPPKYKPLVLTLQATNRTLKVREVENILYSEYRSSKRDSQPIEEASGAYAGRPQPRGSQSHNNGQRDKERTDLKRCPHCKKYVLKTTGHPPEKCSQNPEMRSSQNHNDEHKPQDKKRKATAYVACHQSDDEEAYQNAFAFAGILESENQSDSETPFEHAFALIGSDSDASGWFIDTGASYHLTYDATKLSNVPSSPAIRVKTAKGIVKTSQIGDFELQLGSLKILIPVYYSPEFIVNMLSVDSLSAQNAELKFGIQNRRLTIRHEDDILYNSVSSGGVWYLENNLDPCAYVTKENKKILNIRSSSPTNSHTGDGYSGLRHSRKKAKTSQPQSADIELLHRRLAHVNLETIK